jgi:hypothetical protein
MKDSDKINKMYNQLDTNTEQIIEHVKSNRDLLTEYILKGIENGYNVMLVSLVGDRAFKKPAWFTTSNNQNAASEYNAQKYKDQILTTFKKKPGQYGYGILLGEQPGGFHLSCIDIDVDNECKDKILNRFIELFQKYNIYYHLEITKSGRYHIYVALDRIIEELKRFKKLSFNGECFKYKDGEQIPGEIELLGIDSPHPITVYNGIINNEKPVLNDKLIPNPAEQFLNVLIEFQGGLDPGLVDKLGEFYKIVWKYHFFSGWDIDRVVSAFTVKNQVPDAIAYKVFEQIFGDKYDSKWTEYILNHSKERQDLLPSVGSIIYHAKEVIKNKTLTNEEKEFVKDFLTSIINYGNNKGESELPDYLIGVENEYLISSRKKFHPKRGVYYKEKYFVERNIHGVKEVWYIEIESDEQYALYKNHTLINDPEPIGIKITIRRLLKEKKSVYEIMINDEFPFIPSFGFEKLDEIAMEIAAQCSKYLFRFDMTLFQKYLNIKVREYRQNNNGILKECIISKTTGWNENNTMFFHYDLNDEKHELHKDNPLYRSHKAKSFNQQEQHEFVFKLLQEGELLGVLLTISASSIGLKPLNLQPLTCILAGNPGAGKTTASLIATSLFYKSDTILLNANATNVGIELTLSSLNSLPFVIDEGALADVGVSLKHTIFSVASGKGRTRGRKDLTVDTKDIISNVFWTTETTDIDEIKRGGAFRRMLYLTVEMWENFTKVYNLTDEEDRPNEKYAGCGVDYIKFAVENLDKLEKRFNKETRDFVARYREITGIAGTLYFGIILLEEYYSYRLNQQIVFKQLRAKVNQILEETKKTFILSKDNVVELLQQYLYNNQHRFSRWDQIKDGSGSIREEIKEPTSKEMLGEYDKTTQTYYISIAGFKTIARELEKERNILINALVKAGVLDSKDSIIYHSKVTKSKIRGYKLRFPDPPPTPPDEPANTTPPDTEPPDTNPPTEPNNMDNSTIDTQICQDFNEPLSSDVTNEVDDFVSDAFSEIKSVKPFNRPQPPSTPVSKLSNQTVSSQLTDIQISEPKPTDTSNTDIDTNNKPIIHEIGDKDMEFEETEELEETENVDTTEDKEKKNRKRIVVSDNETNIYDVKPRHEIPKYVIKPKNIKPFSDLVVGSLDIETTGLEGTDKILAIAFNVYKNDMPPIKYRFYLFDYDDDESKMVSEFLDTLASSNIDVLTGWNLYDFDLQRIKAKDTKNKLSFTDPVNVSGVKLNNHQLKGYCLYVDDKYIEVIDAMHLVIKYDNIARDIPAQDYKLKSVAKHFGISKEDRVILGADEIRRAYEERDIERLEEYHGEDVREAYEVFKKLAPPYYYIRSIVPFKISFFDAFRMSTAAIWEKILEYYYGNENLPKADEKADYEGGLVIVNKGLYRNVYKIDVASLYPNIMLNYHVYSRKDKNKIALAILNEYTNLRLQLKKKAKEGDTEADLVQNSLKILINSLYGFYGTGGYPFNDMYASALVTAYGRKILKYMIDYVETNGGIIIECDTDGIFFSAKTVKKSIKD